MKKLLTVLLAIAMVFGLVGCGGSNNAAGDEGEKVLSIMYGGGTPLSMDPALNSASAGGNIIRLSHAGLMGYDANGKLTPELAESYTVSDDGLTYVFTLRKGLKWSDGTDFNASDVEKSWKRAASAEVAADYGFLYDMVEGNDGAGNMNVVADDAAGTFTVKLAYVAPYFLDLCAFSTLYAIKADDADVNGEWAIDPAKNIGMGPFKMISYTADDVIVYEKNEYYWNAANVALDGVKAYLAEENAAILAAYENDEVQFINSVAPEEFDRLKSTYGDEFVIADQMGTWYILFNVHKDLSPAGKTLTVQEQSKARYALGQLINRKELTESVYVAGEAPATGFYPAGLSDGLNADVRKSDLYGTWYENSGVVSDEYANYTVDQVEACKTLIDLGYAYTGSLEGGDLAFTDVPNIEFAFNNSGANKIIIEYVQATWAKFGINGVINQDAWSTLQAELKKGNAEAARMGWVADFNDCTNFIEIFISKSGNNYPRLGKDVGAYTKATATTADAGLGAYWGLEGNQTWAECYDALDQKILYAANAEERAKYCAEAEKIIMASGAVAPVYFYTNPYMAKSSLTGFNVLVGGEIIVQYAKIA